MPELQTVEQPKTAGFVNPNHSNRNRKRIEEDEKEIEELEGKPQEEEEVAIEATEEAEDKDLTREEKSFKKRYGDLRRHMGEKETEWKDKLETLEKRIKGESVVLPKSDQDIEEWANKYPDVAGIVETIATKKAKEMFSLAESRFEELDAKEAEMSRVSAENAIREAHSDFDKLKESDNFHDWVDAQPKWAQDALYENSDDPDSVIRIIDLYKIDNNLTKSDYSARRKAAASAIKKGKKTKVVENDSKGSFTESQIAKMSASEYEKQEEEINNAIRSGKFIYDLSGPAR
jgi:hypothetical protein